LLQTSIPDLIHDAAQINRALRLDKATGLLHRTCFKPHLRLQAHQIVGEHDGVQCSLGRPEARNDESGVSIAVLSAAAREQLGAQFDL
jgi:hypothetical protein